MLSFRVMEPILPHFWMSKLQGCKKEGKKINSKIDRRIDKQNLRPERILKLRDDIEKQIHE